MYKNKTIGVYIHIPFCISKCNYCDFLSFGIKNEKDYILALCNEIESFDSGYRVDTIFFGGGTPSIIDVDGMEKIFNKLRNKFIFDKECEISIEMNPATFDKKKLRAYKEYGINRLSIGCQTTDDNLLRKLGRAHTYNDFLNSHKIAREEGFKNINVDIMAALPSQTLDMHIRDIDRILNLNVEHISVYGLIIEEGTPFFVLYNEENGKKVHELMDEDESMRLYEITTQKLNENEYYQYEISNYSKKGYECRHNLRYWRRKNYVGFGLGASGCIDNIRYRNTQDFNSYIKCNYKREKEILTKKDINNEIIMLGLRLNEGIKSDLLYNISNENKIKKLIKKELIVEGMGKIYLSDKGREISNYVISELMI